MAEQGFGMLGGLVRSMIGRVFPGAKGRLKAALAGYLEFGLPG